MNRNIFFAAALLALAPSVGAAEMASLSAKKANVRSEPGGAVLWEAYRFTPFRVTARRGSWVEIEDFEGDSGWVHKSVLGKTPAVIVKTVKANLRDGSGAGSKVLWVLEKGYPLKVIKKEGSWYNVTDGGDAAGWLHASTVWGYSEEDQGDEESPDEESSRAAPAGKKTGGTQTIESEDTAEEEPPAGEEGAAGAQGQSAQGQGAPPEGAPEESAPAESDGEN